MKAIKSWFLELHIFVRVLLGCGCLLFLCLLCSVPIAIGGLLVGKSGGATELGALLPANTSVASQSATKQPAATVVKATKTPRPTLVPSEVPPTSDPSLLAVGTYLVGTEIEAGLYIGNAGEGIMESCYWERLSSLSGDSDAIIQNDNSIGRYYIYVKSTDKALTVGCPVKKYDSSMAPASPSNNLVPGTYLVGVDMNPGTYAGLASDGDSCYWERLSGFDSWDSILANDNSEGKFYVQVSGSVYALTTHCPLERVGD